MEDIVRLRLEDIDDFLKMEIKCFPEEDTNPDVWKNFLNDERTLIYAIKEDEVIKSQIAIYNWKGKNNYIKIMTIGTDPEYRNNGYAHKLMQYIIDKMLEDDMYIFKGETRESNLKMQKIFEDFDYKIIDKVENYYDNPSEMAYKYALEI